VTNPLPINVYVIEPRKRTGLCDTGQDRAAVTDPAKPRGLHRIIYRRSADSTSNQGQRSPVATAGTKNITDVTNASSPLSPRPAVGASVRSHCGQPRRKWDALVGRRRNDRPDCRNQSTDRALQWDRITLEPHGPVPDTVTEAQPAPATEPSPCYHPGAHARIQCRARRQRGRGTLLRFRGPLTYDVNSSTNGIWGMGNKAPDEGRNRQDPQLRENLSRLGDLPAHDRGSQPSGGSLQDTHLKSLPGRPARR